MTEPKQDDKSVEKTVQLVAYVRDPARFNGDFRALADEIRDEDFYERSTSEREKVNIVYTDECGDKSDLQVFNNTMKDALEEHGLEDPFGVEIEREVDRDYTHSPKSAFRKVRGDICNSLPGELPGGLNRSFNKEWQDESHMTRIWAKVDRTDEMRVLRHRSERSDSIRFEDGDEQMAVVFEIELGKATEDLIETWSDAVVKDFYDSLARLGWVSKVRLLSCTERVEQEGDCYSV